MQDGDCVEELKEDQVEHKGIQLENPPHLATKRLRDGGRKYLFGIRDYPRGENSI
jgi:hypothetical protein